MSEILEDGEIKLKEPKEILKKRYELEIKLIEKGRKKGHPVTVEMLAAYFDAPPPAIKRDLGIISKELFEHILENKKHDAKWIQKRRAKRDDIIKLRVSNGEEASDVWADFGLWRHPRDMDNPGWKLPKSEPDKERTIRQALCLCRIGFRPDEAFKYLGVSGFLYERELLDRLIRSHGYDPGHAYMNTDREALDYVSQCIEKEEAKGTAHHFTELIVDLARLTGVKRTAIRCHADKGTESDRVTKKRSVRIEHDETKERIVEYIYQIHQAGIGMESVGDLLGLDRITVANYVRSYRIKNGSDDVKFRKNSAKYSDGGSTGITKTLVKKITWIRLLYEFWGLNAVESVVHGKTTLEVSFRDDEPGRDSIEGYLREIAGKRKLDVISNENKLAIVGDRLSSEYDTLVLSVDALQNLFDECRKVQYNPFAFAFFLNIESRQRKGKKVESENQNPEEQDKPGKQNAKKKGKLPKRDPIPNLGRMNIRKQGDIIQIDVGLMQNEIVPEPG